MESGEADTVIRLIQQREKCSASGLRSLRLAAALGADLDLMKGLQAKKGRS
jgi:hypothetical protein